jgi:hypothetical protein
MRYLSKNPSNWLGFFVCDLWQVLSKKCLLRAMMRHLLLSKTECTCLTYSSNFLQHKQASKH